MSHHSAAALWKLLKPINGPIHVSVPATTGFKKRRGIHLHRCPSLAAPREPSPSPSYPDQEGGRGRRLLTTQRDRIPVTTIPRTVDDLEGTVAPYLFRRAKRQAELMNVRLEGADGRRARSDLEEDFFALLDRHRPRLPLPETNVKIGRWEVDFLWREQRLVVETDSFLYHAAPSPLRTTTSATSTFAPRISPCSASPTRRSKKNPSASPRSSLRS